MAQGLGEGGSRAFWKQGRQNGGQIGPRGGIYGASQICPSWHQSEKTCRDGLGITQGKEKYIPLPTGHAGHLGDVNVLPGFDLSYSRSFPQASCHFD